MNKFLGEVILEVTLEFTAEENIEMIMGMTVMIEAGTGPKRGHFPEIMAIKELEVQTKVDPGQDTDLA